MAQDNNDDPNEGFGATMFALAALIFIVTLIFWWLW